MNREWLLPAKILTGICALAVSSFSQTYTVSAKPGALNYIQGEVSINGDPVWKANLKTTFLNANDLLTIENGKAEVLLTPGVFLRVGEHSQVRMIQPSLISTQLEVVAGESMVEVDDVVPGSSVAIMDHGSVTTLTKVGLFRFTEHSVASLDGKADVAFGTRKLSLGKNKEVQIDDALRAGKVDLNQPDDLYAWSNTRAQYNAAASYAGSTATYNAGGYGYSSFASPGWYWASGFNSYMWLPGNGAFYSPFGWGFYGPGLVAYAPVTGVYVGGYGTTVANPVRTGTTTTIPVRKPVTPTTTPLMLTVPVNPRNVGVSNFSGATPAGFSSARTQAQNYAEYYGLQTSRGTPAAVLRNGQTYSSVQQASRAAAASAQQSSRSTTTSGGWSNSNAGNGGGYSAASSGPSARTSGGGSSSMGSTGSMSHATGGGPASGGHVK